MLSLLTVEGRGRVGLLAGESEGLISGGKSWPHSLRKVKASQWDTSKGLTV